MFNNFTQFSRSGLKVFFSWHFTLNMVDLKNVWIILNGFVLQKCDFWRRKKHVFLLSLMLIIYNFKNLFFNAYFAFFEIILVTAEKYLIPALQGLLCAFKISSSKPGLRTIFCHKAGLSDFSLVFLTETSLMLTTVISEHKGHIHAFLSVSKWTCFTFVSSQKTVRAGS